MTALSRRYDAALLDLDGTIYLGGVVIDHVAEALTTARADGMATAFVTNNASRPPAVVAEALQGMGIQADEGTVFTSSQAAADMLATRHPPGSAVLVVGAPYLEQAIADVGLVAVRRAADHPVAVVQGHSPDTGWADLAEACIALRAGADWVACNTDATLPTDRGMLPGNGAMVAALVAATGRRPQVAGKPERPLVDAAVQRLTADRPLVVGDRMETDIQAASTAGVPALMPLTGVSTAADLLAAAPSLRPTHVCFDLRGLVDERRVAMLPVADGRVSDPAPTSGVVPNWQARFVDGQLVLAATSTDGHRHPDRAEDSDALQALVTLVSVTWPVVDSGGPDAAGVPETVNPGDDTAAAALDRLGIPRAAGGG